MPRPAPRLPSLATTHRPFRPGTTHAFRRAAASSRPNPTTPVRGHEGLGAPESAPRSRRLVGGASASCPHEIAPRSAISLVPPKVAPTISAAGGLRRKGSASRAFDSGSSGSRAMHGSESCRQRGPPPSVIVRRIVRRAPRPSWFAEPVRSTALSWADVPTAHATPVMGPPGSSDPPRRHGRTYPRRTPHLSWVRQARQIHRAIMAGRIHGERRARHGPPGPSASTGPSPSDVATARGVPVMLRPARRLHRAITVGRSDGARRARHAPPGPSPPPGHHRRT